MVKEDFDLLFYERLSKPMLDEMLASGVVDFSNYDRPHGVALSLLRDAVQYQHPAVELMLDHLNVPENLELKERIVFFQLMAQD